MSTPTTGGPRPDWSAIFRQRPDLEPPGYCETVQAIRENPYVPPKKRESKG